jgi:hypothetical protein
MARGGARSSDKVDWERESLEQWKEENEQKRRKSPEEKRLNEIKGGVITSSVGLGVMIFLRFLFDAIADLVPGPESNILRAIPFVGVIPFLIGLGIIFNGLVVSKRIVELKRRQEEEKRQPLLFTVPETSPVARLSESTEQPISEFSVVEPTTTRLREPVPVSSPRDTN